jgi:L-asparagine oxygenase
MQSHIVITPSEARLIREAFRQVPYDAGGSTSYISQVRRISYSVLPSRVLELLERQRQSRSPHPYLMMEGLPIDEVVHGSPAFDETGATFKSGMLSEAVLCGVASVIGEPYSIFFEGRELVNNLTPQQANRNDYTGLGSDVELDFHIENAALKFAADDDLSPMGLALLGVRADPAATGPRTFVADIREAIKLLDDHDLKRLYGKNYIIRIPHRWRSASDDADDSTGPWPLLSGPRALPRASAVFYSDMVLPINDAAKKAFERLHNAIKAISIGMEITPGTLIYVDNRFALHSRERFRATYDENGRPFRWVQRVFVAASLWNFRSFCSVGERVFTPALANRI